MSERCEGFLIRRITTKAGKIRFQVDLGTKSGKHVRRSFKTKNEARAEARRQAVNVARGEIEAVRFNNHQRTDAIEALKILEPYGVDLRTAAHHYALHHKPVDQATDFAVLAEGFIEAAKARADKGTIRKTYAVDMRRRLLPFIESWRGRHIDTITGEDIEAVAKSHDWRGLNRKNYLRALSVFFNAMRKQKKIKANPCKDIEAEKLPVEIPKVYTPAQVEKILHITEHEEPSIAAYMAITFFAGVRPDETKRLEWDAIDLELKEIHISADTSKTRRARLVHFPENLLQWLKKYNGTGKIFKGCDATLRKRRKAVYTVAGIEQIQDGARHSFATYHYALHGLDATMEALGHESPKMLHEHYKGMVKNRKPAAEKYFGIMPKADSQNGNPPRCDK